MSQLDDRIAQLSPEQRRALLGRLAQRRRSAVLAPVQPGVAVPATVQQQQLWFVHRLDAARAANNLAYAWTLRGDLDAGALHAALQQVVDTHEMLRASLVEAASLELRVAADLRVETPLVDLSATEDPQESLEELLRTLVGTRFDLERAPLHVTRLVRLAPDVHVLVLVVHHLVWDAGSVGVFLQDLATAYRTAVEHGVPRVPERPVGYRAYAAWQRERLAERRDVLVRRWRELLADAPVTELPTDRARPAVQTFGGSAVDVQLLDADAWQRLQAVFQDERATGYAGTLGLFAHLVGRWTRAEEVVVGSPVDLRLDPRLEDAVGFFVNLVAVRCPSGAGGTAREQVRATQARVLEVLDVRELPFADVVAAVNPVRSADRNPLVQVEFAFETFGGDLAGGWPGLQVEHRKIHDGGSRFDVSFVVRAGAQGLSLTVEYNHDLFDRASMLAMADAYRTLLERVVADPDARLSTVDLCSEDARASLVRLADGGPATSAVPEPVLARVLRHAATRPDAVAVQGEGTSLTYGELVEHVAALVERLVAAGAGRGDRVLLLARQSPEAVAGMLACHAVGAAYVPLDPDLPAARRATVAALATATACLVGSGDEERLLGELPADVPVVRCVVDGRAAAGAPTSWVLDLEPTAYVLFTSGSTGTPKGVSVGQDALAHFCDEIVHAYGITPEDRVLAFARPAFDVSVFEVFASLYAGGTVCVVPPDVRYDPVLLTVFLQDQAVTVAELPPALMPQLPPAALPSLRLVSVGGEAFAGELVAAWTVGGRQFWNGYGPTECTVAVTLQECTGAWTVNPPIGRPLPGCRAYVVDDDGALLPRGAVGELVVAGRSVARGYLADERRTAEQFVVLPAAGERVYRTGDLVRWRGDGTLDFLGRRDRQVKVNGFRVELAEVEAALRACPGVVDAVVDLVDRSAGRSLVAWVVEEQAGAGADALVGARTTLPAYAVPTRAVAVGTLPVLPSGKPDRPALHRLLEDDAQVADVRPVRELTETERALMSEVVGPVLGVPGAVDPDEGFFALGGNSLQATQVVAQAARRFGVRLSVADFFQNLTVAQLAQLIDDRRTDVEVLA